jgi:hypothetical protein
MAIIDCRCPLRSTSREIMRHGREKTSTTMAERREAFWLLEDLKRPWAAGRTLERGSYRCVKGERDTMKRKKGPMFTWPSKFSNATGAIADLEAEIRASRDT